MQQSQGLLPPGTQFDVFRGVAGGGSVSAYGSQTLIFTLQLHAPTPKISPAAKLRKSYASARKHLPLAPCSPQMGSSSSLGVLTGLLRYIRRCSRRDQVLPPAINSFVKVWNPDTGKLCKDLKFQAEEQVLPPVQFSNRELLNTES
jgi:hypothetical protein